MKGSDKVGFAAELATSIRELGGKSELLGPIGSYGDAMQDVQVLHQLRRWNDHFNSGARRGQALGTTRAIAQEIHLALEALGAPAGLLGTVADWGDGDDETIIAALRAFNRNR